MIWALIKSKLTQAESGGNKKKQQAIFQYLHGKRVFVVLFSRSTSTLSDGGSLDAAAANGIFLFFTFILVIFLRCLRRFFSRSHVCVIVCGCGCRTTFTCVFWCAIFSDAFCRLNMCLFSFFVVCIFRMFHARNCIPFGASICLQVLVEDYLLSVLKYTNTHTQTPSTFQMWTCVCEERKKCSHTARTHTHTHTNIYSRGTWRESWYGFFAPCVPCQVQWWVCAYVCWDAREPKKSSPQTVRTSHSMHVTCMLNDKLPSQFPLCSLVESKFHPVPQVCAFFPAR